MKKYILALVLCCGTALYGQAVYAEADYTVPDNVSTTQTVDKNILADEELMKTITSEQLEEYISQGADANVKFIRKYKDPQDESKFLEVKNVTPLMMAALGNPDKKVFEILLENGADIKAQNENGKTAFMYAAQENPNPEVIETLLKHGADVNAIDKDGWTALMHAARDNENSEVIETLLQHGADVNAYNQEPLFTAAFISLGNPNHKIFEMII